jgi:hypothetical protein
MRTNPILALFVAILLISPAPAFAGLKPGETQLLASTEKPQLQRGIGLLSFPDSKQILFRLNAGQSLEIACSDVTHTTFTTKSKTLKKVAVPAVAAAVFTMGLSLFALAIRGHGYYLVVGYGKGQQAVFSMGKDVYAQDVNATSACTGKPTEMLK